MAAAPSSLGTQKKVTFGGRGSGNGQFNRPWGVTVSEKGKIFVADLVNERIQIFTMQGTFVRQFPTVVSGKEKLRPKDVAMDREGNLWAVGDSVSAEFAVQYNKQGSVLGKFDLQKTEPERGVAVDTRRNHILITQSTGHWSNRHGEVLVFRPDGTLVRTVGQHQGMKCPQYITVDGEGNILVSDRDNDCVYVYNEDGQFLFRFGGRGAGEGQLMFPRGICTDRAGNIIVADCENSRVEMFDKTGKFLKHIVADYDDDDDNVDNVDYGDDDDVDDDDNGTIAPMAVALTTEGQLVVTHYSDNSVSIFQNF